MRRMRNLGAIALLCCAACAGANNAPALPSAPVPPTVESDPVAATPIEVLALSPDAISAPEPVAGFPMAVRASDFDIPLQHNSRVQHYLELMTVRHRRSAEIWLGRQNRFDALIESRLAEAGLPLTLKYLPLVESGYLTDIRSSASARGLWQFMAPTAREVGLEVDGAIDDRFDPVNSTDGAIRHLARLHDKYENWYLALAAYNSGAGRVDRALRAAGVGAELGDSAFWAIHDRLPSETRDYVPFFMAAAVVSRYPDVFGFGDIELDAPLIYDEVTVPDETELAVVARLLDVPRDLIADLNPRYRTGVTPRGRASTIRLPEGAAAPFAVAYAALPESERVTVRWHVVRRGETLSGIASRYGVSTATLQSTNGISRPNRLQVGARLRVPTSGAVYAAAGGEGGSGETVVHRVRSGESVWSIARRYGVRTADLLAWNDLTARSVIHPGDRLRIRR